MKIIKNLDIENSIIKLLDNTLVIEYKVRYLHEIEKRLGFNYVKEWENYVSFLNSDTDEIDLTLLGDSIVIKNESILVICYYSGLNHGKSEFLLFKEGTFVKRIDENIGVFGNYELEDDFFLVGTKKDGIYSTGSYNFFTNEFKWLHIDSNFFYLTKKNQYFLGCQMDNTKINCYSCKTGALIWECAIVPVYDFKRCIQLIIKKDLVIFIEQGGIIKAIDSKKGKTIWQYKQKNDFKYDIVFHIDNELNRYYQVGYKEENQKSYISYLILDLNTGKYINEFIYDSSSLKDIIFMYASIIGFDNNFIYFNINYGEKILKFDKFDGNLIDSISIDIPIIDAILLKGKIYAHEFLENKDGKVLIYSVNS